MATKVKAPKAKPAPVELGEDYFALVREFPLVAIRDDEHHDAAIAMADRLLDIPVHTPGQEAYLLALGTLIRSHESEIYGEPEPMGPAEALAYLIEAKEITQADLARATGISKTTISDVIAGRREPSKAAIRAFAAYFKTDAGFFI